jgi:DNA repair exonuclease SbcCD nuclease subunit
MELLLKIGIISDSHYGIRGDSQAFLDMSKRFTDEILLPTLKKHGIQRLFHLGDLVDKRKTINIVTASRLRTEFLEPIFQAGIFIDLIIGNHDTSLKSTNSVNSPSELYQQYKQLTIHAGPADLLVGKTDICIVPWICDENRKQTSDIVAKSKAKYCFGHLELCGYQMYKGVVSEHGDDREDYRKFDLVLTGHYHHKSRAGNVQYVGSHGQFTWSDYNDPRGFHILDLDTGELEFIRNPFDMFNKFIYDDVENPKITSKALCVKDTYVKVVIRRRENNVRFDKFIADMQEDKPLDIQIIDEAFNVESEDKAEILQTQDTLTIFKDHIDQLEDMDVPKADLERLFIRLYQEASEIH